MSCVQSKNPHPCSPHLLCGRKTEPSSRQSRPLLQELVIDGGFPKIRDTFLGVPIIGTIVFGGLCWGPIILGNYQISKFGNAADFQIH